MRDKLLYAFTAPQSAAAFLRGQADFMAANGFEVHVAASPGPGLNYCRERYEVKTHELEMEREISPIQDAVALIKWIGLIYSIKPSIVNYGTPKASLLCSIAAFMIRVPKRVYIVRGLRYESETGAKRSILLNVERLIAALSTDIVVVSESLGRAMRNDKITKRRLKLIGSGSSNGINSDEWTRRIAASDPQRLKESLAIPPDALVVLFVGRVTEDKGTGALMELRSELLKRSDTCLLIVGPAEAESAKIFSHNPALRTFVLGKQSDVAPFYALADVLVLPTKREGFPNVVLEAAIARVPTVTMDVTGAKDAVLDGDTGYVVPADDAVAMTEAVTALLDSADLRRRMGEASSVRAREQFDQTSIWLGLAAIYVGVPDKNTVAI